MTTLAASAGSRWRPALGGREATALAAALAIGLSAAVLLLVLGQHGGGVAAGIAAVTMTAPVAYARITPSGAGLSLMAAVALNELFFGHLIRCGAALPAAFYVAFACGVMVDRRGRLGLVATAVSVALQCIFDPRLGAPIIGVMVPLTAVFFGAGLYIHRRAAMVTSLRTYTKQLQDQREQTADLAVAADREALTDRLGLLLVQRIETIEQAARDSVGGREQFATIEALGRQTLEAMRELVGSLHDAPIRPEPGLIDLPDVCARATTADVTLTVDGAIRPLPASIELSACRIVEQLLRVLRDEPAARVQLRLDFAVAGLDIAVSGAPTNEADLARIEAIAHARASLHGGSVDITNLSGQRQAHVWLPLVTAHG